MTHKKGLSTKQIEDPPFTVAFLLHFSYYYE